MSNKAKKKKNGGRFRLLWKKRQEKLKKELQIQTINRDYPKNSQIWYGSPPHHYKYPHGWIKDEARQLKSNNEVRVIITSKSEPKEESRNSANALRKENNKLYEKAKNRGYALEIEERRHQEIMMELRRIGFFEDLRNSIKMRPLCKNKLATNKKTSNLICGFCGVNFNSSEELNIHLEIHPKCTFCGKRMLNEEILKRHHHS